MHQVSLEQLPQESFVHVSAQECWLMVCRKLNQEIRKQQSLGKKQELPPLQPLGSINGLEMFGFLTPSIVQVKPRLLIYMHGYMLYLNTVKANYTACDSQAIEGLDPHQKSAEYWENKVLTNKSLSSTGDSLAAEKNSLESRSDAGEITDSFETDILGSGNSLGGDEEIRSVFGRLLRKANPEEMEMMHKILCKGSTSSLWRVALETLTEEIQRNPK